MAGSRKSSRSGKTSRPSGNSKASTPVRTYNGRTLVVETASDAEVDAEEAAPRRGRRVNRRVLLLSIGIVLLVFLLAGGGYLWWTVQKTLPTINGTVKMAGLSAPATLTRDVYGVPHIVAANVEDMYAAQGYVHAQDRLFQMFLFRAVGQARLSEYFGEAAVEADRFYRTVGFRRAGEAELAALAPEVRKALDAYSRGVNEFIHTHGDSLPLEFSLLSIGMEDWTPADTLTFGKVQSWDLSQDWDSELLVADLRERLGSDKAAQFLPDYPSGAPVIVPGANSGSVLPALERYNRYVRPWLPSFGQEGLGSNNWVVDGTKSATGKPLLANDPHLGVRNPSIWYQNHLATSDGKYDVTGFSFAGSPGVITGHNRDIAWGVTNTGADVQDLFIETLDPEAHPGQYLSGSEWKPLTVITEVIKVKGGEPITQTIRITNHGPIISDAIFPSKAEGGAGATPSASVVLTSTTETDTLDPILGTSVQGQALAMQWSALGVGKLFNAVYDLQAASDWQEFRAALSQWSVPGQNFVYADKEGNIGYQMTGEMPIRKQGDGTAPVPGAAGEYDWTGYIPFDELPRSYNPPEHYIATANHKPFGADYKYDIQGGWAHPWRIERITEMLKAKDKLGVEDFQAMHMDTQSPVAKKVAPILAGLKSNDPTTQQAIDMFKGWDGDIKADSPTAAIYEVVYQQAISETMSDDLGRDLFVVYLDVAGGNALRTLELLMDKPDDPIWDRSDTSQKETRDDILLKSLTTSVADMRSAPSLGENMQEWQWGKIHTTQATHPFGAQPVIGGMFNLSAVPIGGDGTTVAVAPFSLVRPFFVTNHQSYRMIIDVGDWTQSRAIYQTGQSGQPFAKHWGDMLTQWQKGEYNPLLYTTQQIDTNKEGTLTLTP
ncbi:MAG TPA: penicillin acylase family protein [Chloroflexia bacterium]|nr:penicillin acylase family protein [Chloroflexia bacterium]